MDEIRTGISEKLIDSPPINEDLLPNFLVLPSHLSDREILNIAEIASRENKKLVLCSVPAQKIRRKLLKYVSIAILNEYQIREITELREDVQYRVETAVLRLYGRGADTVVVKMDCGRALVFADEMFLALDCLERGLCKMNNQTVAKHIQAAIKLVRNL